MADILRLADCAPPMKGAVVETGPLHRFFGFADAARRYKKINIACGNSGAGKTWAATHYASGRRNVYYIPVTPSIRRAASFFGEVHYRLSDSCRDYGKTGYFVDRINDHFEWHPESDDVIIVDDAQDLEFEVFRHLRFIASEISHTVILVGTPDLRMALGRRSLTSLRSRINFWHQVSYSADDYYEFAVGQGILGEEARKLFVKFSQKHGLHLAASLLEVARGFSKSPEALSLSDLRKAASVLQDPGAGVES